MFGGLTSNALAQVKIVEQMIEIHEAALINKDAQARRRMKIYSVSSCVTNLYAIYERFVEAAIADYLDAIPELLHYKDLPIELRNEYRIGISHILSRIDSERYNHLKHEDVILWYHEALSDAEKYRFVTEALTGHEQNLRLTSLESLLSKIRLTALVSWLTKSSAIKNLYGGTSSIKEQLEAELQTFIQIRNDAAHGGLDDLEGKENLQTYCTLIRYLIESISEYMHKSLLDQRILAGKCKPIGKVTEIYNKPGAFIVQLKNKSVVYVGMNIHLLGENYCFSKAVESLRFEDKPVERIESDRDGLEVGITCQDLPKKNATVYIDI
jgi:hypothetical protein